MTILADLRSTSATCGSFVDHNPNLTSCWPCMSNLVGMSSTNTTASRSATSSFTHDSLPHPITHIRLLEILPSTSNKETAIQCRLRAVRLVEYDQCFTAISYTWDHAATARSILVNGCTVEIKINLYQILCQYREKLRLKLLPTVFIWVDALCLDRQNTRERNSQVQIVPNIFSKAKTVIACLDAYNISGTPQISSGSTSRFTDFLTQAKSDLERPQNQRNDAYLTATYCSDISTRQCRYAAEWRIMMDLCQHEYWSRLWVLLENRFASNLVFLYDDCLWSWLQFRAPFLLMWYMTEWSLYSPSSTRADDPAQILNSPAVEVIRSRLAFESRSKFSSAWYDDDADFKYLDVATERWHITSERTPLDELLDIHKRRKCTERVDKIYALLGLSDSIISVDYDRSNIELFCTVLLSFKTPLSLEFVSMLAHQLGVSAFQYQQNRRSILRGVPSTMPKQSIADMIGHDCRRMLAVRSIGTRTEISDILQARLGLQKMNFYQVTAQQNISSMKHWSDFPESKSDLPRVHGYKPGTSMPVVDGFDLSDASFGAAMFVNPTSRQGRKAVFGMISTNSVQDGDILVTEEKMNSGILVRVSGLSKTWLTVVGLVLFARRVTVESQFSPGLPRESPTCTMRSATLSDFCDCTHPTPFTITGCDDREHFTLRPHDIQLQSLLSRPSTAATGRHSRSSSGYQSTLSRTTTLTSKSGRSDRRLKSQSDRLNRFMEALTIGKRSNSK